jgi:hypothetical protein
MLRAILLIFGMTAVAGTACARDTVLHVPLQEVLDMPQARDRLDGSVRFFLAGQRNPHIATRLSDAVSNKKTFGGRKDDRFGCKWAALSVLRSFQASARRKEANAVVNIISYYKKKEVSSPTEFECHAGSILIGVALKGTYARIDP